MSTTLDVNALLTQTFGQIQGIMDQMSSATANYQKTRDSILQGTQTAITNATNAVTQVGSAINNNLASATAASNAASAAAGQVAAGLGASIAAARADSDAAVAANRASLAQTASTVQGLLTAGNASTQAILANAPAVVEQMAPRIAELARTEGISTAQALVAIGQQLQPEIQQAWYDSLDDVFPGWRGATANLTSSVSTLLGILDDPDQLTSGGALTAEDRQLTTQQALERQRQGSLRNVARSLGLTSLQMYETGLKGAQVLGGMVETMVGPQMDYQRLIETGLNMGLNAVGTGVNAAMQTALASAETNSQFVQAMANFEMRVAELGTNLTSLDIDNIWKGVAAQHGLAEMQISSSQAAAARAITIAQAGMDALMNGATLAANTYLKSAELMTTTAMRALEQDLQLMTAQANTATKVMETLTDYTTRMKELSLMQSRVNAAIRESASTAPGASAADRGVSTSQPAKRRSAFSDYTTPSFAKPEYSIEPFTMPGGNTFAVSYADGRPLVNTRGLGAGAYPTGTLFGTPKRMY